MTHQGTAILAYHPGTGPTQQTKFLRLNIQQTLDRPNTAYED